MHMGLYLSTFAPALAGRSVSHHEYKTTD